MATMFRYGFLLDEHVEDESTLTIHADMIPETVTVSIEDYELPLEDGSLQSDNRATFDIVGIRSGSVYRLTPSVTLRPYSDFVFRPGAYVDECTGPSAAQSSPRSLAIADQFPVDTYVATVSTSSQSTEFSPGMSGPIFRGNYCINTQANEDYPEELSASPGPYLLRDVDIDLEESMISWQLSAAETPVWSSVRFQPFANDLGIPPALWHIDFAGSEENIRLPALPADLAEQFSPYLETTRGRLGVAAYSYIRDLNFDQIDTEDARNAVSERRSYCIGERARY